MPADQETRRLFGLSEGTDSSSEAREIFGLENRPKSKGLVQRFSDLWKRGDEEFGWFKKTKESIKPLADKISKSRENMSPWEMAALGDQAPISPEGSAEFAGQFIGSPNALAGTAAGVVGAGAAAKLPKLARLANNTGRVISGSSAVAQVPAFSEAMRKGDKLKAVGTGLGIGLGTLGARAVPEHPNFTRFPEGPKKSFTLTNPSERNLADLTEKGFIPGPVMPKKQGGQMILGDDRVPGSNQGELADNLKTNVKMPYAKETKVKRKVLVKDAEGKPVLDEKGNKTYTEKTSIKTDPKQFKEIFQKWANGRRSADYSSAAAKKEFSHLDEKPLFDGNGVNKANLTEALAASKPYFDKKYAQLTGSGKQLGYREDYIPQMWDNTPAEVDAVFGNTNARLSLKKGFELKRVIENYEQGIAKGLKPKFDKISDIAAFYEKHADKAIEDKNFFDYLRNSDLISTKKTAGRVPLPESLFPVKRVGKGDAAHWNATPEVHAAITGFLENPELGRLGKANQFLKTTALAAGVPKTGINFHGVSVVARDALASDTPFKTMVKDIKLLANPKVGEEFVGNNLRHAADAQRDGLILSTEHIPFRAGEASNKTGYEAWAGRVFEDPLFQKAMPAMKLERYDAIRNDLVAKGLDRVEAGKLAASQTNQIFGGIDFKTMLADTNSNKAMKFLFDKNSGWFLAPQWLASQGYIAKDMAKALGNPNDPRGRVYHQMAKNLAVAYTYANVTNKILSGHWMGENERGKFFEIDTGQTDDKGKKIYTAPFGTGVDFVRIPVEIAGKLVDGDPRGLFGMARGRLGPVASLSSSALHGENWAGKPLKDFSDYAGLTKDYLPPFMKAGANLFNEDQSLLQTATESVELPFRFREKEKKKKR